jgi:hypothetical protein
VQLKQSEKEKQDDEFEIGSDSGNFRNVFIPLFEVTVIKKYISINKHLRNINCIFIPY